MKRLLLVAAACCFSCQEEALPVDEAQDSAAVSEAMQALGANAGIHLTWEQATAWPGGEDQLPEGPTAIAANGKSVFVLDQLARRALSLGPQGIVAQIPMPPGVEGLALEADRLWAVSFINHRAWALHQKTGEMLEEVELPKALAIDRLEPAGDELLMVGSYQNTFSLGSKDLRLLWPSLLSTQKKGIPGPQGARFQTRVADGRAELWTPLGKDEERHVLLDLPADRGRLMSAVLLKPVAQDLAVLMLEFDQGKVARWLALYDDSGRLIDEAPIESDLWYVPRTEFAVVPVVSGARIYQLLPRESDLTVRRVLLQRRK